MSENDTENKPEKKTNNKLVLGILGVGGVLGAVLLCAAAALLWIFWPRLFGGGDPIAEKIPNDAVIYMNVDLLNMQSENFQDLMLVFQEMADPDQDKILVETLDEQMDDLVNMNFTDDVLPWVGQYGGLAILDLDLGNGDGEYIWVVETRDRTAADQFISDFVQALDDEQDMQFDDSEKEGIVIFTHEPDFGEDLLIARAGNFVYFSNTESAILDSAALDKNDSLASLKIFEDAYAELPNDRVASAYFSNALYPELFDLMAAQYYMTTTINNLEDIPLGGVAMSMSADEAGLRFDFAVSYDEDDLSEFEKEAYAADYLAPTTDQMVPADTFFYLSMNQSHDPSFYFQEDSPMYNADTEEALELLNDQYGIDMMEFISFLGGEFAFAMGPSSEGFISEQMGTNIGFTTFISTHDESGFSNWFEDVLGSLEEEMYVGIRLDDLTIEGYELHKMTIGDYETPSSVIPEGNLEFGETVSGSISSSDGDAWTFSGNSGDVVTIAMDGDNGLDSLLQLKDSSGFTLVTDDDSGGDTNALIENYRLSSSGVFTIQATGYSGDTGPYTLTLTQGSAGSDGFPEAPSSTISMVYGADNGYIILGSSEDILEEGLGSNTSLAESEIYLNTWTSFPSGSVPYMFINMTELFDFIKEANPYMADSFQEIDNGLDKIPVVAISINETTGYTQAFTLIIFVETE